MRAAAQRYVPGFASAQFEGARICWRPMPLDGYPVLGASPARPDVYLAVMHSGVTLAPIVGELVAGEIVEGPARRGAQGFPARPQVRGTRFLGSRPTQVRPSSPQGKPT